MSEIKTSTRLKYFWNEKEYDAKKFILILKKIEFTLLNLCRNCSTIEPALCLLSLRSSTKKASFDSILFLVP